MLWYLRGFITFYHFFIVIFRFCLFLEVMETTFWQEGFQGWQQVEMWMCQRCLMRVQCTWSLLCLDPSRPGSSWVFTSGATLLKSSSNKQLWPQPVLISGCYEGLRLSLSRHARRTAAAPHRPSANAIPGPHSAESVWQISTSNWNEIALRVACIVNHLVQLNGLISLDWICGGQSLSVWSGVSSEDPVVTGGSAVLPGTFQPRLWHIRLWPYGVREREGRWKTRDEGLSQIQIQE